MSEVEVLPAQAAQGLAALEKAGSLTRVGLKLPTYITPDEYEAVGTMLKHADQAIQWAIGDWIAHGEAQWGEESYQYIEALGISEASRSQHVRVATRIPMQRRRYELTWSHHRSVSHLEEEEQDSWLEQAVVNQWPKYELEFKIKEARTRGESPEPPGRSYVVEAVLNAAEAVWDDRVVIDDGSVNHGSYIITVSVMEDLGYALGEGTREA